MAIISNKKLEKSLGREIYSELLKEIRKIDSPSDLDYFFDRFMTVGEKTVFLRRVGVIQLLKKKLKYRDIRELLGISSGTISKVNDIVAGRGYSRNPDRKREYSVIKRRANLKKRGLRYKGAQNILDLI